MTAITTSESVFSVYRIHHTVLPRQLTYRTPLTRLQALPQRQSVDEVRRHYWYDHLADYVVFTEAIIIVHL